MPSIFQKYAHNDASKRRKIGGRVGKPSVVSAPNVEFSVQHTIRADRANEGLTASDVARALLQLKPELKPIQSRNYTYHTFKVKSKDRIKHNPVIAQNTTSKRANVQWLSNTVGTQILQRFSHSSASTTLMCA